MTDVSQLEVGEIVRRISSNDAQVRLSFIEACPPSSMKSSALMAMRMDMAEMRPQAIDFLASTYSNTGPYEAAAKLGEATYRLARSMYEGGDGDRETQRMIAGRGALNWMTAIKQLGQHKKLLTQIKELIAWLASIEDADNLDMLRLKRVETELDLGLYDAAGTHIGEITEKNLPPMVQVSYRAHRDALRKRVGGGTELQSEKPVYSTQDLLEVFGWQGPSELYPEITVDEAKSLMGVAEHIINKFFGGDREAVNEFTVRQKIIRASYLFNDPIKGRDPNEIAKVIPVLIYGRDWMREHNFMDSENDACWSLYLCYSRTKREDLAARELQRLRANIERARSQIAEPNERARLSSRYPYLYQSLATMLYMIGDVHGLFEVIEASKGRVLADLQTLRRGKPADDAEFTHSIRALPTLLKKAGATYLTYLVDDEVTFAILIERSGALSMHRIELGKSALEPMASVRDPRHWGKLDPATLQRNVKVGDELGPLVACLDNVARDAGAKHICYSGSGPLLSLPLHCARLRNKPLATRLSVSRVHGAASMFQFLAQESFPPAKYLSVEVPAIQDLDDSEKVESLSKLGRWLQENLGAGGRIKGKEADLAALRKHGTQDRVIHFATHGTFPRAPQSNRDPNPYRSSGVLLAANGTLPDLNTIFDDDTFLLSPAKMVETKLDFTGSHVTLNGCVTGLAKAGAAGDALGLEFALLQLGAHSILSTHWDSNAISMSQFMSSFYSYWLVKKLSRAAAWSKAVCEAIERYGDTDEGAYHWAAFSLTGDWR